MKRRIRAKVWWPNCDKETEHFAKKYQECMIVSQPMNPPPMKRHVFPNGPWEYIATDILGPLPSNEFVLALIDYYSRYTAQWFVTQTFWK